MTRVVICVGLLWWHEPSNQVRDGRDTDGDEADLSRRRALPARTARGLSLDFLAELTPHIPDQCEHLIRHNGWHSNKSRGQRTLRFPHPADLFDPFTGQRLARRVTEFSHHFADKETLLARYAT